MKEYKTHIPQFALKMIPSDFIKSKITDSKDGYNYIKQFYSDDINIYESFFLLLLNKANNTIGYVKISQGGIVGTVVDIQLVAKYAAESLSKGVVLAHNHPSGRLIPSNEDKLITKRIVEALKLFDIQVLDHLILSEDSFYSFADEELL